MYFVPKFMILIGVHQYDNISNHCLRHCNEV
jgi:hypothetical protein